MLILKLGERLEKISVDDLKQEIKIVKRKKNEDGSIVLKEKNKVVENSAVFVTNFQSAKKVNLIAGIDYEGEINQSDIEFCKVEAHTACIAGNLRIPKLSDVCGNQFQMAFFINKKHIVIVDDGGFAEEIIARICNNRNSQGASRELFLYNFIAQFISKDLEFLGRYERRIRQMEEKVIEEDLEDFMEEATKIRRELLELRGYYDELRDLGKALEDDENNFFKKKNIKYFGIVNDRADRLMNRTMQLLDYLAQVQDAYRQKVAEQQNRNMEFLTIISTIFFPLTLITGWYGMNFQNMPELQYGYPGVIVLSIIVVIVIIFIFKKRKIL